MNITDVGHLTSDADTGEDKMVEGAKREHKTVMEIAKFYTDAFFEDCRKLNIKRPDVVEPATNCIDEFIHMIEVLLEKGYAYKAGENIYFDTSKLRDYYVFGSQSEEELLVGAREDVTEDPNKRNKTTSSSGSPSRSSRTRRSNGTARGASVIRAGTSNARTSPSSTWAGSSTSTAAASTTFSRITPMRSPSLSPTSATNGAITGSTSIT